MLIAALGWFFFLKLKVDKKPAAPVAVVAEKGQHRTAVLPDGSTVQLNSATEIRFDSAFFQSNRLVQLAGEAWFEVKKSAAPFRVVTTLGSVEAVGTAFSVRFRDSILRVECFEGSVRAASAVGPNDVFIEVAAGQKALLDRVGWSSVTAADSQKPDFLRGESRFDEAPLRLVLDEMERQFDLKIDSDLGLNARRFSGTFAHGDLDLALRLVCEPLGLRFKKSGDHIQISSK